MELAEQINAKPLPPVSQRHGLLLPPDEDALLAQNMQLHVRSGRLSEAATSSQDASGSAGAGQELQEKLPMGVTSRGAVLPRPAKHQAFSLKQGSPARSLGQLGSQWGEEGEDQDQEHDQDQEQEREQTQEQAGEDTEMKDAGAAGGADEDDLAKELEAGLEDEEWM